MVDIIEAAFVLRLFSPRNMRFSCGGNNAADQGEHQQCGGSNSCLVSSNKLRNSVSDGRLARANWQTFEVSPDIFRELLHRGVSVLWLLAKRHENNIVQIAG